MNTEAEIFQIKVQEAKRIIRACLILLVFFLLLGVWTAIGAQDKIEYLTAAVYFALCAILAFLVFYARQKLTVWTSVNNQGDPR